MCQHSFWCAGCQLGDRPCEGWDLVGDRHSNPTARAEIWAGSTLMGGVKPWWGDKKGACKSQGVAGTAGVGAVWGQDPAAQVSLGCGPKPGRAPGCSGNNEVLALFQLQNLLCPSHYIRQVKLARNKGFSVSKDLPRVLCMPYFRLSCSVQTTCPQVDSAYHTNKHNLC